MVSETARVDAHVFPGISVVYEDTLVLLALFLSVHLIVWPLIFLSNHSL